MSLQLKTLYNALVGAWGGFVAWFVLDVVLKLNPTNVWLDAVTNGAIVGMFIGALVSGFGGVMERRAMRVARGLGIGLVTGIGGGIFGLLAGEAAYQIGRLLDGGDLLRELFRAIGWSIFGIGIGVAEGVVTFSSKRFLFGGLGGFIGGLVGGIAFTLVTRISDLQLTNRALGFALLGAFIGLFVGLIPDLLKNAWLKVISSGRNEGKEFLLDKQVNAIGSADNCDVGLYGDPTVAKKHAEIRQAGGQFTLHTQPGETVIVNNAPETQTILRNGMQFRVGNIKLVFRQKGER